MSKINNFEDLRIWQEARELVKDISKGSCGEVRSMYYSAEDLQYISPEIAQNRRERAKHISGGISGLMNHLKSKIT